MKRPIRAGIDGAAAAIVALGVPLSWLSSEHPSWMPIWAPWDFSPATYLSTAFALLWFFRGLARLPADRRPAGWRQAAFLLGIAAIYVVLQTRYEYLSQHMFFLNRIQHVTMHHLGPFLIALAGAGPALRAGMPAWARHVTDSRTVTRILDIVQQPLLAAFLFVGLFVAWLIPDVHFRAMLDHRLYFAMNASMVIDGLLFWPLVLDPRPSPPARLSFAMRAALSLGVVFPQLILGATITFTSRELYPYYELCGRLFTSMSALDDQSLGGIISWIPPGMMGAVGALLVVNALRLTEERTTNSHDSSPPMARLSSRWTGR